MSSYKTQSTILSASDALSQAFGELISLQEEMDEWASNLESSNLASTSKCESARQAADDLQSIDEIEFPTELAAYADKSITVYESVPKSRRRSASRAVRRDNAVACLQAVIDSLTDLENKDDKESADDFIQQLQDAIDYAEPVEFPGMYS